MDQVSTAPMLSHRSKVEPSSDFSNYTFVDNILIQSIGVIRKIGMDYPLENLGPERFQQFCQALLAKEYPDMQCFPVAQPDGGRDAVSYHFAEGVSNFSVFQVK